MSFLLLRRTVHSTGGTLSQRNISSHNFDDDKKYKFNLGVDGADNLDFFTNIHIFTCNIFYQFKCDSLISIMTGRKIEELLCFV